MTLAPRLFTDKTSNHRKQIRSFMEDKILFKGSRNDAFSVKIMYRMLDCSPQVVFPSCTIWNPVIPPRIGFFAWEASWEKVLMLDQLKRQGRALADRCILCEEDEEDINHLLVHCKKARMLWDLFLLIVGTSWVFAGFGYSNAPLLARCSDG